MEVDASKKGYEPPPEFTQTDEDPLCGISLTDSTELWLIQLPPNQFKPVDFDGKEVKLKLRRDGRLGSLVNSAGKSFDIVSNGSHEPNATVFLADATASRAVGKISRRVNLVSYELDAESHGKTRARRPTLMNWGSDGAPGSSNRFGSHGSASLSHTKQRSLQGISGTSFEVGEASQTPTQRRVDHSPSSHYSKPTVREGQSSGPLSAFQRSSMGINETSFEGEASKSRKQRHVDGSPSSQDSKRSKSASKSRTPISYRQ